VTKVQKTAVSLFDYLICMVNWCNCFTCEWRV